MIHFQTADIEVVHAHLTMNGYMPKRLLLPRGVEFGISNGRQAFYVRWDSVLDGWTPRTSDCSWERLGESVRKLAIHITPEMQGFTGDGDG